MATSTSFINFGAFTFVNLSVIATYVRERATSRAPSVAGYVVAPLIGAGVDVWLLAHLDSRAIELDVAWLIIGIVYLVWLTRLFRLPQPALDFSEDDPGEEQQPTGRVDTSSHRDG